METAVAFGSTADLDQTNPAAAAPPTHPMKSQLWKMTCDRIDVFPSRSTSRNHSIRDANSKSSAGKFGIRSGTEFVRIGISKPSGEPAGIGGTTRAVCCCARDVIDTPEFKGGSISVFSLGRSGSEWCGCLFCHNLTPAPVDDTAISESPVEEDVAWNVTILPISLIPEEGSDNHVVPLPVFTAPVEDVTVQQNKVRLFVLFVNFTWWLIDYELLDPVNEEIRSGPSHLLLLLAQEVIDQSLTSLTILPSVNTQVYELWSFPINEGNQSICSYVDLISFFSILLRTEENYIYRCY